MTNEHKTYYWSEASLVIKKKNMHVHEHRRLTQPCHTEPGGGHAKSTPEAH